MIITKHYEKDKNNKEKKYLNKEFLNYKEKMNFHCYCCEESTPNTSITTIRIEINNNIMLYCGNCMLSSEILKIIEKSKNSC